MKPRSPRDSIVKLVSEWGGTGVDFVKDAKGAVTAMIQHWVDAGRYFAHAR
jgi:hypothetical protein